MSIYEKTVYFRICANCGSLDWEEYVDGVEIDYTTDEDGDSISFDEDYYGDVVEIRCHDCGKNSVHELTVDRSEWRKLYNMDGRDRLIYLIQLMAEKRIEFDKEFVDDVIEYHKNDEEFIEKISDYLQTLGYTTKMTWIEGD